MNYQCKNVITRETYKSNQHIQFLLFRSKRRYVSYVFWEPIVHLFICYCSLIYLLLWDKSA